MDLHSYYVDIESGGSAIRPLEYDLPMLLPNMAGVATIDPNTGAVDMFK